MGLRRFTRSGSTGWALLALFVVVWDYGHLKNGETLSSAFVRGTKHPVGRWPVTLAWVTLTLHLYARLPQRWDPFHRLARLVTRGD